MVQVGKFILTIRRWLIITSTTGLLIVSFGVASEDALTLEQIKAHYIVEITRNTEWPNENNMSQLRVGITGNLPELIKTLNKSNGPIIRGKRLVAEPVQLSDINLSDFALLYIAENENQSSKQLFEKTKNTLVIVDGDVNNAFLMMSFVFEEPHINLKLNRQNLKSKGFKVSSKLLQLAGTKQELGDELRDKEQALVVIENKVQLKEKELRDLSVDFNKNQEMLSKVRKEMDDVQRALAVRQNELEMNRLLLADLIAGVESSELRMLENQKALTEQQQSLLKKQQDISNQERIIKEFQSTIEKNKTILSEQLALLNQRAKIIEQKESTISLQKTLLFSAFIAVSLFLIMSYYLYRENRLKKEANIKLFELATTDSLTGLFNRRHFLELAQIELERQIRHQNQAAVLMVDIDNFKKINDTYGHAAGDEVLKQVASILKNSMRKYDLIGRLGGEEFALMLCDCDFSLANEIAQRMCKKTESQLIEFKKNIIKVTISIGLTQLCEVDKQAEEPLVRADKALYDAKNSGRNRVVQFERR